MGRSYYKRLLFAAILIVLLCFHVRRSQSDDFYTKTVKALDKKAKDKAIKEETDARLQGILDGQSSLRPTSSESEDSRVPAIPNTRPSRSPINRIPKDSQARVPTAEFNADEKFVDADSNLGVTEALPTRPSAIVSDQLPTKESPQLARVRIALDEIIQQHGIVIFSKTYCPHSRRAKSLLLDTYDILPVPHVVELDTMTEPADPTRDTKEPTMGKALQNLLADRTGRGTVPNVLVRGKSIGGADELVQLDAGQSLTTTLRGLAGERLQRCEKRDK
jgi:glutaredoxin